MMPSLYTGVTAMNSNQMKIDVISNNIANANTIGYKYQTVSFSDVLNQEIHGASAPQDDIGGVNPMQVGLGVGVASVSTVTTMGSLQYTGNPTDLAISGDGYFVVHSPGGEYNFTRAGNFGVDASGNLVTAEGYQVCGWQDLENQADGTYVFDTTGDPEPINIFESGGESNRTIPPNATTEANISGNLNSSATQKGDAMNDIGTAITDGETPDYVMPMTVVDSLGAVHEVDVEYYMCYSETSSGTTETSYYWRAVGEDGNPITDSVTGDASEGYVKFDSEGNLIEGDSDYPTSMTIPISPGGGAAPLEIEMDFSSLTMYGSESNVLPTHIDGNTAGELTDFSVDSNGVIMGVYSNGQQKPIGVLCIANFSNPSGLEKSGHNIYQATQNSGSFDGGNPPGVGGAGIIGVGTLEMSNVDLSREYSELIVAQRGFQASSSIISTVDELLQDLINLKR